MTAELVDAVRVFAEWDTPDKHGTTKRDHLIKAGRSAPQVEISHEAGYLWGWYVDLDSARGSNGFGVSPVSYTEIDAWARLNDVRINPNEVRVLKDIDRAYLSEMAKRKD